MESTELPTVEYWKKKKKFFGKRKSGKLKTWNLGNLGNLGNIIPNFLKSKFSILPYSQNRKLGFKDLGKKFPSFPSFRPGHQNINYEALNILVQPSPILRIGH